MTDPIQFEAEAEIDYFDDGGTNMGVVLYAPDNQPYWVIVADSLDHIELDRPFRHDDHPVNTLVGKRCRVTIEILENQP